MNWFKLLMIWCIMVANDVLFRVTKLIKDDFLARDQLELVDDCSPDRNHYSKMSLQITAHASVTHRLYRFDLTGKKTELFPFFNDIEGLKRICDYIIICVKEKRLYVLCVELKRGGGASREQLEASKLLMKFVIDSAIRINEVPSEIGKQLFLGTIRVSKAAIDKARAAHNMPRPLLREPPLVFKDKHLDYTRSNSFVLRLVLEAADRAF